MRWLESVAKELISRGDRGRVGAIEQGATWAVREHSSTISLNGLSSLTFTKTRACLYMGRMKRTGGFGFRNGGY
jgi:hypothetical protein